MGGSFRFLQRIWTLVQEHLGAKGTEQRAESRELQQAIHHTVKRVTEDLHELGFNTAIAAQMELVNELYKLKMKVPLGSEQWRQSLATTIQLLAPFAPHIAEELWQQLGQKGSVHTSEWPLWDTALLASDTISIVVQVNGKLRGNVVVPADADEAAVTSAAKMDKKVAGYLKGQQLKKTVYVPGRLVNFVV